MLGREDSEAATASDYDIRLWTDCTKARADLLALQGRKHALFFCFGIACGAYNSSPHDTSQLDHAYCWLYHKYIW